MRRRPRALPFATTSALALRFLAGAISIGGALSGGCGPGGGTTPSTCPNVLPAACPDPAPTFAGDAQPIITARCAPCHAPGGIEANRPFQTYDQIYSQRVSILTQVHACKMPPADGTPLTDDEKVRLLGWLKCGSPNN